MSHRVSYYLKKFYQYNYNGYLRHYYNTALSPHPLLFIFFAIAGACFFFVLAVFSTLTIINNQFQGSLVYICGLTLFMYFLGLAIIPTIILSIQGYRHRKKIKASDVPDYIPKSSGGDIWYIIIIISFISILRNLFE